MWYDIDMTKFAQHLLPPMLRKVKLFSLIKVLIAPYKQILAEFKLFRQQSLDNMQINGQVIYIEKILNDTYFLKNKEIYITDIEEQILYMNTSAEGDALVYMSKVGEEGGNTVYMTLEGEGNVDGNYQVNVPSFLSDYITEITRIVEKYKPSGRKYIIKIYDYE